MAGSILTLNAGSSSLKFALFDDTLAPMLRGEIQDAEGTSRLAACDAAGKILVERSWPVEHISFETILGDLLDIVHDHAGRDALGSAGHRIVHGGVDHVEPTIISTGLLIALDGLTPLDPPHMQHNLAPVRAILKERPDLPQVACFDTAFHHDMPVEAQIVPVPRALRDAGVRRYGFHGLSYEYIARSLAIEEPDLAHGRVIVAHLGAGASLCALRGGVSHATTMGFSTLDGLLMATRCGDIDPGVLLYLAREGRSVDEIEDLLYHQSGLLGVSGISGDLRVLLASDDARAIEAVGLFSYRIAVKAGGMASALGGIDGLVFTAAIGERSAFIRAAVCERLAWWGIVLDHAANAAHARQISAADSKIKVLVYATDEEAMIAHHTRAVLSRNVATLHG